MWAVIGLLLIDFLIAIFRSGANGTFSPNIVIGYLQNFLYHIFPLLVIFYLMPIDPTGWILITFYFISGLALIWHYLVDIKNNWRA